MFKHSHAAVRNNVHLIYYDCHKTANKEFEIIIWKAGGRGMQILRNFSEKGELYGFIIQFNKQ